MAVSGAECVALFERDEMKDVCRGDIVRVRLADRWQELKKLGAEVLTFCRFFIRLSNLFVALMIEDQAQQGLRQQRWDVAQDAVPIEVEMWPRQAAQRRMRSCRYLALLMRR